MTKEYVVAVRKDGKISIPGLTKTYETLEEAENWLHYLCNDYRKMLQEEADKEDLNKTNWATMTLADKKKEQYVILSREISPYTIEKEGSVWDG